MQKKIEEVFKRMGASVKVEEIRTERTEGEEKSGLAVIRLREGDKREIMTRKKGLKGDNI